MKEIFDDCRGCAECIHCGAGQRIERVCEDCGEIIEEGNLSYITTEGKEICAECMRKYLLVQGMTEEAEILEFLENEGDVV